MTAPAMELSADEIDELVAVASQPGYRRCLEVPAPAADAQTPCT